MDYILPLKTGPDDDVVELAAYVDGLAPWVDVMVVDGSPPPYFDRNGRYFSGVNHLAPRPEFGYANGKVDGVVTGFALAKSDKVIVADDDVRYRPEELERIERMLDDADVVRPQNYFDPSPWHAKWDSSRSLLNRLFGGDYPGTLGVRLTEALRRDGYDGDVMFENLELIRTVLASGGLERVASDVYVRRLPPTTKHFAGQRVRQAYDSFAQPGRLVVELSLLPLAIGCARRPRVLAAAAAALVVMAEGGRRRYGGTGYFAPSAALFAPLWVAERAVCSWGAVWARIRHGGVGYGGRRIRLAAHSVRQLRTRQSSAEILLGAQ